jgi:hypothetical protein
MEIPVREVELPSSTVSFPLFSGSGILQRLENATKLSDLT